MATIPPEAALAYWERALQAEIGIEIKTDNIREMQRVLYEARKGHLQYDSISICLPNGGEAVWLVKQTVEIVI